MTVLPSHSTAFSRAGGYRLLKLSSNNLVTKNICKPLEETPTYLLLGVLKSVLCKYLRVHPYCQNIKVFKVCRSSKFTFHALQTPLTHSL